MNTLKGKVAIVTGASRGIGAEIARALGEAGARVVVNYSNQREAAEKVVAAIKSSGGQALAARGDVSQAIEMRSLFTTAENKFGRPEILINNAGVLINRRIADTTEEDYDRQFAVNVKGVFYGLREAATRLGDDGRIVNLSSTVTRMILPTYGVYAATKGAVEQLTRVFAKEVGLRGITVNSVSPGPTNTELFNADKNEEMVERLAGATALGRIGEPADITRVVMFLVSEEAGWVTGQNIGANGGLA